MLYSNSKDNSGRPFSYRGPDVSLGADAEHGTAWHIDRGWDRQLNALLFDRKLAKEESTNAGFISADRDGTRLADVVKRATDLAKELVQDPCAKAAAGFVGILSRFIP